MRTRKKVRPPSSSSCTAFFSFLHTKKGKEKLVKKGLEGSAQERSQVPAYVPLSHPWGQGRSRRYGRLSLPTEVRLTQPSKRQLQATCYSPTGIKKTFTCSTFLFIVSVPTLGSHGKLPPTQRDFLRQRRLLASPQMYPLPKHPKNSKKENPGV